MLVASLQIRKHIREIVPDASKRQFLLPPFRSFLNGRHQVDLHLGVREHDGANIAPLHDHVPIRGKLTLLPDDLLAQSGDFADPRDAQVDFRSTNPLGDVLAIQVDSRAFVATPQVD